MGSSSADNEKDDDAANNAQLNEFLLRQNLAGPDEQPNWMPLSGGVSSDIWRVELTASTICVKRALARLKVEAEWRAPLSRNRSEWEWLRFVSRRFPEIAPRPLAHDEELQMLAMEYLEPERYPIWKTLLLNGVADRNFAALAGRTLARVHAESAGREEVRELFETDENFFSLRIEPYLLATARNHPKLAPVIRRTAEKTLATHAALVHGDVSPKNILVGSHFPIFLDAECAWYGDPAFDLAFCLNHFLLKCLARPTSAADFIGCFASFSDSYLSAVDWEGRSELEARASTLLPMIFLARVDGKSPVEYIVEEKSKNIVREAASRFILCPATKLIYVADYWRTLLRHKLKGVSPL